MQGMTLPEDPVDVLMAAWRAELPDVLNHASELAKRIMVLSAALADATRRELPEIGLTVGEFDVLVALRRAGPPYRMKPNQLARSLMLSTGGTSKVTHPVGGGRAGGPGGRPRGRPRGGGPGAPGGGGGA